MQIVPAVDIRGGLCVNLVQGDYGQETVFSELPVAQAVKWHEQCSSLIHMVDLDGAKEGHLCAEKQLRDIAKAGVPYEIGGGIRNIETVRTVIDAGAERVILGTAAHSKPDLLLNAAKEFPGKIVVGIDANKGKVALDAWLDVTETDAVDFACQVEEAGAARIIYTDILSDGMMKGPNLEATKAIAQAVNIPITASGGMSSLEDVRNVCKLESYGVNEVIIGRALYLGVFTIEQAIGVTQETA